MFQEAPADTVVSVYVSESFLENRNMKMSAGIPV